ncbi:hypothetical protein [Arcticibacterium luteifluviistationis]|uniref:Uncharacterized protein n=1 Tax=Arcticibacterium luteifluviistationis TaxID=1784714 RepID=A0A2Z4G806_9BACT|nr:hypothetical protein [Arcticibacterium luteifluviistationis]AWV97193.1 hypothetical protein DJ013_03005 [Arcticibacterium luteifluviistationis]
MFHIIRLLFSFISPNDANERDTLYQQLNEAFETQNCEAVKNTFNSLQVRQLPISVEVRIKLADCYIISEDTARLNKQLTYLSYVRSPAQKSIILNQKAQLAAIKGDTLEAINLLKMAIETENTNTFVKRNYELLKKVYHPNDNRTPPPSAPKANNAAEEEVGGLVAATDAKDDELSSSTPPIIERAQALKLLDAMRANEYNKLPVLIDATADTLDFGNW